MVLKYAWWWFAFTFLLWAFEISFLVVDTRGLLFFSIGIWFQKMNVNLEQKPKWISLFLTCLIYVGFSIIKTFMAFELEPASDLTYWLLNFLHDLSVLAGIITVWYGADSLVRWCMRQHWFVWASSFSFFVFSLHAPLVVYLMRLSYLYFSAVPNYRLITYFIVPVIVLAFCITMAAAVRKFFPGFYRWSTGGRGF
jgi:hypothetical protein